MHARGELDIATRAELTSALDAARKISPRVCVDLTEVPFLDASTLDVLVSADRTCRAKGGHLAVRNASRAQRRLFGLCELEGLLSL